MTTTITTVAQLYGWDGTGTAKLANNITINSGDVSNFPIDIGSSGATSRFTGQRYTITIDNAVSSWPGLFTPVDSAQTITIEKVIVDVESGASMGSNAGVIVADNSSRTNFTIVIQNCAATGTYTMGTLGGGIMGRCSTSNTSVDITITGCYSTGDNAINSGGIVGQDAGYDGTIAISNCFSTGDMTTFRCGGIAGHGFGTNATSATITSCYSTGTVNFGTTNEAAGGITGKRCGYGATTCTLSNCYQSGTLTAGGAMIGYIETGDTVSINNCYSKNATGTGNASTEFVSDNNGTANVSNSNAGNGTWDAELGTDLLDDGTWDDTDDTNPFLLTHFQADPWNTSSYTSAGDTSVSYAAGDPHIIPMLGGRYDLQLMGPFRYFDNNCKNRFIMNGFIDKGDHRHHNLDYIRKIYMSCGNKHMLIDLGFRGKKARVLENNGFEYTEKDLKISNRVKRKCGLLSCHYFTKNPEDMSHNKKENHGVLPLVRNEIVVKVDVPGDNVYLINFRNVNFMNVNPCQIGIFMKHKNRVLKYGGAIVMNEKNQDVLKLDDIKSTTEIKYAKL